MSLLNRIHNSRNPYQDRLRSRKVLCVCSAGLLRSPTAAVVLAAEPFNYNTRAAGISEDFALIVVDEVLARWADEVVCMTASQAEKLREKFDFLTNVTVLNIEDNYAYRDPTLMRLVAERYKEAKGMT